LLSTVHAQVQLLHSGIVYVASPGKIVFLSHEMKCLGKSLRGKANDQKAWFFVCVAWQSHCLVMIV
jgi:hypothetical protein